MSTSDLQLEHTHLMTMASVLAGPDDSGAVMVIPDGKVGAAVMVDDIFSVVVSLVPVGAVESTSLAHETANESVDITYSLILECASH